jgi:hypothetical protein
LQHLKDLIEALMTGEPERAKTAFSQLSDTARAAYQRAYPLAKNSLG